MSRVLSNMKDADIRAALTRKLCSEKRPEAILIEELGLCQGDVFVDVALIDGRLEGFEIKSDLDTLRRLERQRAAYSKVLSSATIVLTRRHLAAARIAVPKWWGILLALPQGDGSLELASVRRSRRNPSIDASSLVQLLWRDEALEILVRLGKAKGIVSKPRREIWRRLLEECSLDELQTYVCSQIKRRGDWRSASKRIRCDDSCPPEPRSQDCRPRLLSSGS